MKINGSLTVKGEDNELVLQSYGDATDGGPFSNHKSGVIKFNSGLKMQWDTVSIAANTNSTETLQSSYTCDHYCVMSILASDTVFHGDDDDTTAWVPTTDKLTTAIVRNESADTEEITYLSIGMDS